MPTFPQPPVDGAAIRIENGRAVDVPDSPVIVGITGDGVGDDVFPAMQVAVNAAVIASDSGRRIAWYMIPVGEGSLDGYGSVLPPDSAEQLRTWGVAVSGPFSSGGSTPERNTRLLLQQELGLYARVYPVRHYSGIQAPAREPGKLDVVLFTDNADETSSGRGWDAGSEGASRLRAVVVNELGGSFDEGAAVGVTATGEAATKRLIRSAIRYAIDRKRKAVTLVSGGPGDCAGRALIKWGYEVVRDEFPDQTIAERDISPYQTQPAHKVVVMDRAAEAMFGEVVSRPEVYDVIVLPGAAGVHLSATCAAQVGAGGMSPGGCMGETAAVFGPVQAGMPSEAGKNVANPCALMLSAAMMLDFIGWTDAASILQKGIEASIESGVVTRDLARKSSDMHVVSTSEFAQAVVRMIEGR